MDTHCYRPDGDEWIPLLMSGASHVIESPDKCSGGYLLFSCQCNTDSDCPDGMTCWSVWGVEAAPGRNLVKKKQGQFCAYEGEDGDWITEYQA